MDSQNTLMMRSPKPTLVIIVMIAQQYESCFLVKSENLNIVSLSVFSLKHKNSLKTVLLKL